jgi:hypothetical protein
MICMISVTLLLSVVWNVSISKIKIYVDDFCLSDKITAMLVESTDDNLFNSNVFHYQVVFITKSFFPLKIRPAVAHSRGAN